MGDDVIWQRQRNGIQGCSLAAALFNLYAGDNHNTQSLPLEPKYFLSYRTHLTADLAHLAHIYITQSLPEVASEM